MNWEESENKPLDDFKEGVRIASEAKICKVLVLTPNEKRVLDNYAGRKKMADEIVTLTKKEIGDAITNYIGIFKKEQTFFPYKISSTDQELQIPETVMFFLDYVPKGSLTKDCQHNI